jgi:hypothetical protein
MSGRANPVMTRFYRKSSEADSCVEAIRLLLEFREGKRKVTCPGDSDDAGRSSNASTANTIIVDPDGTHRRSCAHEAL